jgi:hypothetical protein
MRALSVADIMAVWERGTTESPTQRALRLLALADADVVPERLAHLSIGERDARLLSLREGIFGPRMSGHATCPACAQICECTFGVADIRVPRGPLTEPFMIRHGDCEVCFRLPNSEDLARLDEHADMASNRRRLFERCVVSARRGADAIPADALPAGIERVVAERMAEADPQADVQLALTCPHCGQCWQAPLDIVSFLWTELHAWACRLLREVHTLASAYGWREADIFALSPWRRQAYMELIEP